MSVLPQPGSLTKSVGGLGTSKQPYAGAWACIYVARVFRFISTLLEHGWYY